MSLSTPVPRMTLGSPGPHTAFPPEEPLPPEPMDPRLTWVQPGGGVVCRLELAWGRWRRWWLKTARPGYVRRMSSLRRGDFNGCPHEVLDPRDVKLFRNQGGYHWAAADDPFRWRDRLPFARAGLAELVVLSAATFLPAAGLSAGLVAAEVGLAAPLRAAGWLAAAALTVAGLLVVWFFRDPPRTVPVEPRAGRRPGRRDGRGGRRGRARRVRRRAGGVRRHFPVHLQRPRQPGAGRRGRVVGLRYRPGKSLNALRAASARENEQLAVRLQETAPPYRRYVVRQITGAIARRIVCWLRPGDVLGRGERFGMIKLGSRTELVLPRAAGLAVRVRVGDRVRAGATVVAAFADPASTNRGATH